MDQTSLRFYLKQHPFKIIPALKAGDQPSQFVTCPVRLSFAFLDTPKDRNGKPSYEACLIVPSEADLTVPKQMFMNAASAKFGSTWASMGLKTPVKDQAKLAGKYAGFENAPGAKYFQCGSKFQPAVFDRSKNALPVDQVYSGCWVIALLRTYAYDSQGNKGVGFGLVSLQKLADDERFENTDRSYAFDEISSHDGGASVPPAAAAASTAQPPAQVPGF